MSIRLIASEWLRLAKCSPFWEGFKTRPDGRDGELGESTCPVTAFIRTYHRFPTQDKRERSGEASTLREGFDPYHPVEKENSPLSVRVAGKRAIFWRR